MISSDEVGMEDCQDIYQQVLGRVSVMGISLFQGQSHVLFTDSYFQYLLCTVTRTHDTHYCGDCGWTGLRALVLIATSKEPRHMRTCKITGATRTCNPASVGRTFLSWARILLCLL